MRSLVTGGAGFIGSDLVNRLLHLGHDVSVLENFLQGNKLDRVQVRSASWFFRS
jgi:nucleoside-diphosphate-sugar epimerase